MALLLVLLISGVFAFAWRRHRPIGVPAVRRRTAALVVAAVSLAVPLATGSVASAATITSLAPVTGPATGATVVTVNGTGFDTTGRTRINFGNAAASNVTCTATRCTATAPAGVGAVNVTAVVNGAPSVEIATFTYAPVVAKLTPATGPEAGGTQVRVDGSGFAAGAGTTFRVGGSPAPLVGACTAQRCTITTPPGAGTVNVIATAFGRPSALGAGNTYVYTPPAGVPPVPVVTAIAPASGRALGGTTVTITGTNFSVTTGATTVRFGATPATSVSCASVTSCTATSPAGTGTVNVFVVVGGVSSVVSAAASYTYVPAPTVTAVAPTSGSVLGGYAATITGTGFSTAAGATSVAFGSANATNVACASTTSCTLTVPPVANGGAVNVLASVDGQTSAAAPANEFTYIGLAPLVSSVAPNVGPTTGGTALLVTGENLLGGTLRVGGNAVVGGACTPTQCTGSTPPGAAGIVNVSVQVGAQVSAATAATQFTYAVPITEPPTGTHVITSFPQRDFVSVEGFPAANGPYTISVVRAGLVKFAVPNLMPDANGLMEVNHPGGACWPDPVPDIAGGDVIRVTDRFGIAEQTTTAFVTAGSYSVVGIIAPGVTRVSVTGTASTALGAQLPLGEIEHRFVSSTADPFANGRRTLRSSTDGTLAYVGATTTWIATYDLSDADVALLAGGAESRLVWLGVGAGGTGTTIYEVGPLVTPGAQAPCTGTLEVDTVAPSAPPTASAFVVDFDNVHVTWSAASDNRAVAGYLISRNGTAIATVGATTLSYDDLHVAPGVYTYAVVAFDARTPVPNASPATTTSSVTTTAAPSADLAITVVRTPSGTLTAGSTVDYVATITNVGSVDTAGVITVSLSVPAGLIGVTATDDGGTGAPFLVFACTSGAVVSCSTNDTINLGAGANKQIRFSGTLTAAAVPLLTTTFTVSGGGDNVAANNTATDTASVLPNPADVVVNEPPIDGHGIIAFPGRDFVSGEGFATTDRITVEVYRPRTGGALELIAQSRGNIPGADGLSEVNHPGGGCWDGDPLNPFGLAVPVLGTPNLQPGDKVRYVLQTGVAYQITIAGVKANRPTNPAPGVLVVRGSAQDANGLPLPLDQIEQRMIAGANVGFFQVNGGRRRIGAPGEGTLVYDAPGSINWTATYTGLSQADIDLAMIAESRALWLGNDPLAGVELTIFEINDDVVKGPSAPCITPPGTAALNPTPNLAIGSTHSSFQVGQPGTYSVRLDNTGTAPTTGTIQVINQLPVGIAYVDETSSAFDCSAVGRSVTCTSTAVIGAGGNLTIPLEVSVSSAAVPSVTSFAEVSTPGDLSSLDNFAFDATPVAPAPGTAADLSVTSTHAEDFTATTTGRYTITVHNAGDPTAGTITVTDTLPAGLSFSAGGGGSFACNAAGQVVTCQSNASLARNASASFAIDVLVGAAAVPSVVNTVKVDPTDANPADNTNADPTVVFPEVRAPDGGLHILVFPSRDFVSIDGLTAAQSPVQVQALRNGNVIATTGLLPVLDDPSTAAFEGFVDVNHVGVDDCWGVAPDLRPGDEVRLIDAQGRKFRIVVAGVRVDRAISLGGGVIEVHGTAADAAGTPIPTSQLEQRMVKDKTSPLFVTNGRRDLRTGRDGTLAYDAAGAIAWTARYTVDLADVTGVLAAESRIVWSPNLLAGNDMTLYENGTTVTGGAAAATCAGGSATPASDLGVAVNPGNPVRAGSDATITVTITNNGPAPVAGAVLQLTVPTTVTRMNNPGGTATVTGPLPTAPTWTVTITNTIAVGASVTYTFRLRTAIIGRQTISAWVRTPNTGNDFAAPNDFAAGFLTTTP